MIYKSMSFAVLTAELDAVRMLKREKKVTHLKCYLRSTLVKLAHGPGMQR